VLTQQGGVPVLLSDVARCRIGFTPRLGIAGQDDKTDIIFGIVLMQKLERTMDVVTRVRAAVQRINTDGTLPPGVKIVPFYDRGDLVAVTVRTVLHNMFFGIALIFLIQWLFLGNLRCALIVAATIPVALLLAVIITVLRGESANLPVGRRHRSRHHRRRHRDHGGERVSPSRPPRSAASSTIPWR
jgi:Putative silver efflux pump